MLTIKLAVVVVQLLALISLSECANINHHRRHHLDRNRRSEWSCPPVQQDTPPGISCQCDLPHTLRCAGQSAVPEDDVTAIVGALRALPEEHSVSLLDLSIQNLSRLSSELFEQVTLHGLVISSGEIRDVSPDAFAGAALASALTALGLPNNRLTSVPSDALRPLVRLERLDLSNNRIRSLSGRPFDGLKALRFLDLSGNGLELIGPFVFSSPSGLRVLHLRSNLLDAVQLGTNTLAGLGKLQEIDLSHNQLRGRLTSSFLTGLDSLITLELTANNFTLLKRGMLSGLKRLRSLRLAHNQIDVIEDQSFVSLTSLTTLDLSQNGVVAISGQSLSHLNNLLQLDLSHNYLRAVTTDLVVGLSSLQSLDLTDNDISSVQPGALSSLPNLVHLSLTDNPLNCDCHLTDLAAWLRHNSSDEDNRKSAVCATPPSLENALLVETDLEALTCGSPQQQQQQQSTSSGDEDNSSENNFLSSQPTEDFIRLSSAQVQFVSAQLEGANVLHTVWKVDAATLPYTCDAVLVYELNEEHEALLDSYPVRCHSEEDPEGNVSNKELSLTVKLSDNMKPEGQYRLCLVLFEGGHDDEASLLPGCSYSMNWDALKGLTDSALTTEATVTTEEDASSVLTSTTQITAFYANVSAPQSVSVFSRIPDASAHCQFTVVVFENQRLLARKRLNCSVTAFTFAQLVGQDDVMDTPAVDEYQVCATFAQQGHFLPPPPDGEREADGDIVLTSSGNSSTVQYEHCVVAKIPRSWAVENTLVVIAVTVVFVLIAAALLLLSYVAARRVFFRRSKLLSWGSSDPMASGGVPKATSRHILYVPENDFFGGSTSDSASGGSSSPDCREETSTNV